MKYKLKLVHPLLFLVEVNVMMEAQNFVVGMSTKTLSPMMDSRIQFMKKKMDYTGFTGIKLIIGI